jgi:DNA-binding NtrC family response regulator
MPREVIGLTKFGACTLKWWFSVPRILSVSQNPRLLATRNDALAVAGYSVASPKNPSDAILQFARSRFEAVIIGHSVEAELRSSLIEHLRELQPKVPIVFAYMAGTNEEPLADVTIDTEEDPIAIIRLLDNLLKRSSSGRP